MNSEPKMPRVLIVDGDPLIRWSLESALTKEGYEVTALDSAEKALTELEVSRFDLAIVDVVLPGIDGLELIGRMRSVWPGIKTIVITGEGSRQIEARALEHGAVAYVEKPFSVRELIGLVKTVLPSSGIA